MAKLLRETKQRNAIQNAFQKQERPLGPKEIIALAGAEVPNLGIATVYRNIKALLKEGKLATVEIPGKPPRYCLKGKKKKALFVCLKTDRVFFLPEEAVAVNMLQIPPGFQVEHSEVILYGQSAH